MKWTRSAAYLTCLLTTSLVATTVAPLTAHAQARRSLRFTLRGEALKAFERGVTLYKAKNPGGALAEFSRAYELSKDPRLLHNMAVCERDLKRYSRSAALFEKELKEGKKVLTPKEKKDIQGIIDALSQFTAPLTVKSNQKGAKVQVDDHDVGVTPLKKPVTVDVGRRKITLTKKGFLTFTKTVEVSSGNAVVVDAKLEAAIKRGKLSVSLATPVPGAKVVVDGVEVGPAPWKGDVVVGKHTVIVKAPGMVPETRNQAVELNSHTAIQVTLRKDVGSVRIETNENDNIIAIDGKKVGYGQWEGSLPSGPHQLVVSQDGYQTYQSELAVKTDDKRTVKVTLQSDGGVPWWAWAAGGVAVVGGGVAAFFLLQPKPEDAQAGTITPGVVTVGYPGVRF